METSFGSSGCTRIRAPLIGNLYWYWRTKLYWSRYLVRPSLLYCRHKSFLIYLIIYLLNCVYLRHTLWKYNKYISLKYNYFREIYCKLNMNVVFCFEDIIQYVLLYTLCNWCIAIHLVRDYKLTKQKTCDHLTPFCVAFLMSKRSVTLALMFGR